MVQSVEVLPIHAFELEHNMRPDDQAEVLASCGYNPHDALDEAISSSDFCRTLLHPAGVLGIYGTAPLYESVLDDPRGIVWMLTSNLVNHHRRDFMLATRYYLPELLERYPTLVNFVDERYKAAHRWLKWLGFTIGEPVPFGLEGQPFRPFIKRR